MTKTRLPKNAKNIYFVACINALTLAYVFVLNCFVCVTEYSLKEKQHFSLLTTTLGLFYFLRGLGFTLTYNFWFYKSSVAFLNRQHSYLTIVYNVLIFILNMTKQSSI